MKRINVLCAVLLVAAVGAFTAYNYRYYTNKDTLGPVIEMDESEIYVSVRDPESQLLYGVTATDAKDGDVTDLMMVEGVSNFIDKDTRRVSYVAFDNDNHVSKASRKMIYTDYTHPSFTLAAPLRFPMSAARTSYLSDLTVLDCLDGDISDKITFTADSVLNTTTPADYKVTLEVTNSAGDTQQLPVTFTVYDPSVENAAPKIKLKDYLVYTSVNEKIDPVSYIDYVQYRGTDYPLTDEEGTFAVDTSEWTSAARKEFREREPAVNKDRFRITDLVNYKIPGVYEIQYVLDDLESNRGRVNLIVVVEEDS